MKRLIGIALVSAATAVAAAPAAVQGRPGHEARPFSRPTERVEARLAYIRTALKITDAQQPQWNAFADGARKLAAEREKTMNEWREKRMAQRQGEHQRPSLIERLGRAQQMHAAAIARLNETLAVLKPLYESLSPEQKKVADVVLVPQRGFGRGHGGPRGRA